MTKGADKRVRESKFSYLVPDRIPLLSSSNIIKFFTQKKELIKHETGKEEREKLTPILLHIVLWLRASHEDDPLFST